MREKRGSLFHPLRQAFEKQLHVNMSSLIQDIGFDVYHSLAYWKHNLKGNRVDKRYFSGRSDAPPIILLQGFLGTRSVLKPLENFLRASGRDVLSINLGLLNVGDIRESAQFVNYKIERLIDRFGEEYFQNVDLVGHSMGGLIGLHYIKHLGGHRIVRRLVGLGAPFHGTRIAYLGLIPMGLFSRALWQMLPDSRFIHELQSHPERLHQTQVLSIAAKYDSICPPKSCHLNGAENTVINVGHASLLMDPRVFERVNEFLSAPTEKDQKILTFPNRKRG